MRWGAVKLYHNISRFFALSHAWKYDVDQVSFFPRKWRYLTCTSVSTSIKKGFMTLIKSTSYSFLSSFLGSASWNFPDKEILQKRKRFIRFDWSSGKVVFWQTYYANMFFRHEMISIVIRILIFLNHSLICWFFSSLQTNCGCMMSCFFLSYQNDCTKAVYWSEKKEINM